MLFIQDPNGASVALVLHGKQSYGTFVTCVANQIKLLFLPYLWSLLPSL